MLGSRLREDKISGRDLPSDFLVRVAALRLPSPRTSARAEHVLVPDGLLHPRFARPRSGLGAHLLCRKDGIDRAAARPSFYRLVPHLRPHPRLAAQIGHALRLRVLQELDVLAGALAHRAAGAHDAPLLRRLTRAEFAALRAGVALPDAGAAAVLVVPPVNRDPATKTRPAPPSLLDAQPLAPEPERAPPKRPHLALSVLHDVGAGGPPTPDGAEGDWIKGFSPPSTARVPLYNGAALFPHRAQRTALHAALCVLLKLEARARWRAPLAGPRPQTPEKASHAFLLRADAETVRRADSVPLAIALWRLRMWEGDAWETGASVPQWNMTI
jgi:hypothetical protein